MKLDDLIGLTEEEGRKLVESNGLDFGVNQRDDEVFIRIMLLMPNLVTVTIKNGIIIEAKRDGDLETTLEEIAEEE